MLVTKIACSESNDYLSARMRKAYAFLRTADLEALPLGRNEIDGNEVFANVSEYETVSSSAKDMEAHRLYYDIQYIVSGEELIQYAQIDGLQESAAFDEAGDCGFYVAPENCTEVVLRAGEMAVLAPEDAHKPGCQVAGACKVRKVVVKVHV